MRKFTLFLFMILISNNIFGQNKIDSLRTIFQLNSLWVKSYFNSNKDGKQYCFFYEDLSGKQNVEIIGNVDSVKSFYNKLKYFIDSVNKDTDDKAIKCDCGGRYIIYFFPKDNLYLIAFDKQLKYLKIIEKIKIIYTYEEMERLVGFLQNIH